MRLFPNRLILGFHSDAPGLVPLPCSSYLFEFFYIYKVIRSNQRVSLWITLKAQVILFKIFSTVVGNCVENLH